MSASHSVVDLHSLAGMRAFLTECGYRGEDAPAEHLFALGPSQSQPLRGARIIATAGPQGRPTLFVIWVPQPRLRRDLRARLRHVLAAKMCDGLLICTEDWQAASLYLLRQEEEAAFLSGTLLAERALPKWLLNLHALRPADRQGLALLDLRAIDPFELGNHLLRAFGRAQRQTLYQNQGLFSNYYLGQRLAGDMPGWSTLLASLPTLKTGVDQMLQTGSDGLDLGATMTLVWPVLEGLGWAISADSAGQLKLQAGGASAAFCQVLPWNAPLDVGVGTAGAPDLQLIGRLVNQDAVLWGMLTNGPTWRLVFRRAASASGVFYEVQLPDLLAIGEDQDLNWFAAFFGAAWLAPIGDGPSLLNEVYQRGQIHAQEVGENLKQAIFSEVFTDLAGSLIEARRRQGQPADSPAALETIYRATLILLYRLLFVLYAESRELLPLTTNAYYPHSLTFLLSSIALQRNGLVRDESIFGVSETDWRLWSQLRALFRAIDQGEASWGVPRYNGGLFADNASAAHRLLAELDEVPGDRLSLGLDHLARETAARSAKDEHGALQLIDYMDLDVRRLGSIYEGLLEFQLRQAAVAGVVQHGRLVEAPARANRNRPVQIGELYLETTQQERKASGSYYTPDYIVRYIVEQTVGPVLAERAQRFKQQMQEVQRQRTALKRTQTSAVELRNKLEQTEQAAIEALLDLKVLDPAMGSGHFLVAAVNFLSDQIIGILRDYPDNPLLPKLAAMRQDILANLDAQNIPPSAVRPEQLSDRVLLRRMIMKRCIFGVDLNDLAVELAKLSLWLDSFTVGAPLSFLDHHLKHGNSLIGIWEVERFIAPGSARWNEFMRALSNMVTIGRLADSTFEEVQASSSLYAQVQEFVRQPREQLNVDLAANFAALGKIDQARRVAYTPTEYRATTFEPETLEKFERAQAEAETRHFFHWKLEFPEVFVDHDLQDWKADGKGGFDAVIGNPPWLMAGYHVNDSLHYLTNSYKSASGKFDLYYLFIEQGVKSLTLKGLMGLIIPNKFIHTKSALALRKLLIEGKLLRKVIDFGDEQIFEGAVNYSSILFLSHDLSTDPEFMTVEKDLSVISNHKVPWHQWVSETWGGLSNIDQNIFADTKSWFSPLQQITERFGTGVQTGADSVLILSKIDDEIMSLEPEMLLPIIRGRNVRKYSLTEDLSQVIFPYKTSTRGFTILSEEDLRSYQNIYAYLLRNKSKLESRIWFNKNAKELSGQWFGMMYIDSYKAFSSPHILTPSLSNKSNFVLGTGNLFVTGTAGVTSIIPNPLIAEAILYLLSLLNSRIVSHYVTNHSPVFSNDFYKFSPPYLKNIPIRRILFTTPPAEREALTAQAVRAAQALVSSSRMLTLEQGANGWPRFDPVRFRATELGKQLDAWLPQDEQGNFVAFAEGATGSEEWSDVVHDLLAHLAQQMIDLNTQRQGEIKRFLAWLEAAFMMETDPAGRGGIDALANKTTLQNYLGDYQKGEAAVAWDDLHAVLHKNRRRFGNHELFTPLLLPQLRTEYQSSLDLLAPIKTALARTDALIDQIVYRLYGLSQAEIAVVEGRS